VTPPEPPTWVACLTPPGQGALATLGLWGPRAWEAVRALFRPRRGGLPSEPAVGNFWLGRLGGELSDEVVVAVKAMTPTAWLEVHGHGGPAVLRLLTGLFVAQGLQCCSWQEFVRHTGDDPLSASATIALAEAPTARTATILLDQQAGALGKALDAVLAALDAGQRDVAGHVLGELCRHAPLGRHLTGPWQVVIAGAANVGKSSLVNAVAGYQRAVVSSVPGTTRDVVTTRLAIDGWPVEVSDTAGLRPSGGALEEEGMRRARAAMAAADLCLWVLDACADPAWPDAAGDRVHLVVNKIDQPPAWDLSRAAGALPVSALTGQGLGELCAAVSRWLAPDPPPPGAAVPFTDALGAGVEQARQQLEGGLVTEARRTVAELRRAR
jgi:tRNA modification GTPase